MATIQPEELLEALVSRKSLARYTLGVYSECDAPGRPLNNLRMCPLFEKNPLCREKCCERARQHIRQALSTTRPQIFHCHFGLLSFAVPFTIDRFCRGCIVGGGVREKSIDLWNIEELAQVENFDPFELLDHLERLPEISADEVTAAAEEVAALLPSLQEQTLHGLLLEKVVHRMASVSAASRQIDEAETAVEACRVMTEAIGILLDAPSIAVALADGKAGMSLCGGWNFDDGNRVFLPKHVEELLRTGDLVPLAEEDIQVLFPSHESSVATARGFFLEGRLLGALFILDLDIFGKDLFIVDSLAGRTAARLLRLQIAEENLRQQTLSGRMVSLVSRLAIAETRQDLYRSFVEAAAELVGATAASLMIAEDGGETLTVEYAIGMNLRLAKTLSVKTGTGIAGKVAESGQPLLVTDIEKDERVGGRNRPRFKTKSFLSIPLKMKDELFGVLNLSEKEDNGIFTPSDLELVQSLAQHGCAMISRIGNLEQAATLEYLSVTDHLTGLYNRRFLEKRLKEEVARAVRQKQSLTVMMIDLDYFKLYNDTCGHPEGDKALKKSAAILKSSARTMDIVTRYGGEEFCIVLPGTSKREAVFVAERIRRGVENHGFLYQESLPFGTLTTSVGVASFPEDGETPHELVEAADIALYNAKAQGRNRVSFYSDDMRSDLATTAEG